MKSLLLLAVVVGCGAPREAPLGPGPGPGPIVETPKTVPSDIVDQGVLVTLVADKPVSRETFTIKRSGTHLVLQSTTKAIEPGDDNGSDGELEVDEKFHPVRASVRKLTSADGLTYKLGGTPLTLDVTRDDNREPRHQVATRPIDAFFAGPGMIPLTALCRVQGDVAWNAFSEADGMPEETLEAYVAAPIGALHRVVLDIADEDFEVLCAGSQLIAGGIPRFQIWIVREGREADLDALKNGPRPPKKDWKHPQNEAEPWSAYHTWLFDGSVLVTRDGRRRTMRLTAFDAKTGAILTHRDFKVPYGTHLMCEQLPRARLICEIARLGYLQVLDARTLADTKDLAPAVEAALPGAREGSWSFDTVKGDVVDLIVAGEQLVRIDVAKGTAVKAEMPKQRNYLGSHDPSLCSSTGKDGPYLGTRLLGCKVTPGWSYALTYEEDKSELLLVGGVKGKQHRWRTTLGAHPVDVRVAGALVLVTTVSEARRVIAVDSKTGVIKWVAAGPLPATP